MLTSRRRHWFIQSRTEMAFSQIAGIQLARHKLPWWNQGRTRRTACHLELVTVDSRMIPLLPLMPPGNRQRVCYSKYDPGVCWLSTWEQTHLKRKPRPRSRRDKMTFILAAQNSLQCGERDGDATKRKKIYSVAGAGWTAETSGLHSAWLVQYGIGLHGWRQCCTIS